MAVIHEGSSAFSSAQNFIINFNSGVRDSSTAARRFEKGGYLDKSSIMKATRDLTMRFPVICSDTLSPSVAAMVNKAIERNATSTLQLLFASTYLRGSSGSEVIRKFHKNIDDDISMDDYLNIADGLSDAISKAGAPVPAGGAKFANAVNKFATAFAPRESCVTEAQFIDMMMKSLSDQLVLEDDYSETVISNYVIREASDGSYAVVYEIGQGGDGSKFNRYNGSINFGKTYDTPYNDKARKGGKGKRKGGKGGFGGQDLIPPNIDYDKVEPIPNNKIYTMDDMGRVYEPSNTPGVLGKEIDDIKEYLKLNLVQNPSGPGFVLSKDAEMHLNKLGLAHQKQKNIMDALRARSRDNFDKLQAQEKLDLDTKKYNLDVEKFEDAKKRAETEFEYRKERDKYIDAIQKRNDQFEYFQKQLLDNDVKKCNELVPSLIIIRYNVVDASEANKSAVEQQFIAGVKAWLYPETSANIINKISDVFSNNKGKMGWIKATTGEINFMKDFVLGISKAKISAKEDKFTKISPIWTHLKYRSNKSVLNRLMKNKPNDAGAITTLVISSEEADYLKKELEIDLLDVKQAQKIMEAYNFMGIVIVDENFEVARFLFDGAAYYEDIAFSSLEREDKDSSYKKVVNLISKINRG